MQKSMKAASLKSILAAFFEQVTEADIAMQLNQLYTWREAAEKDPILGWVDAPPLTDVEESERVKHAIPDLLEGVDRLNNLAIGEVNLEFDLISVKPAIYKKLWARLTGKRLPRRYRLAPPPERGRMEPRLKLRLTVKRGPLGAWQITSGVEHYPQEFTDALMPELF
jgi:hypothetical protein